jgi:hypothetical protein
MPSIKILGIKFVFPNSHHEYPETLYKDIAKFILALFFFGNETWYAKFNRGTTGTDSFTKCLVIQPMYYY